MQKTRTSTKLLEWYEEHSWQLARYADREMLSILHDARKREQRERQRYSRMSRKCKQEVAA
jgi:hypothetical protein